MTIAGPPLPYVTASPYTLPLPYGSHAFGVERSWPESYMATPPEDKGYAFPSIGGEKIEGRVCESRAARRRAKQRSISSLSTAPSTPPPREVHREVAPERPSPAEVLELLASPKQKNAFAHAEAALPLVWTFGSASFQTEFAGCASNARADFKIKQEHDRVEDLIAIIIAPDAEKRANASQASSKEYIARLEASSKDEKTQLVHQVREAVMPLALSKYGTRIVQKAIEVASQKDLATIVDALEHHIEELLESPHGNYVVQKIVEVLPSAQLTFVVERLQGQGVSLAQHRFGCRVLERLIEHCDKQQLGRLVDEIVDKSAELIVHKFGNFVLQHMLQYHATTHEAIFQKICEDLPVLVLHCNGSWVVEKAVEFCDEEIRNAVITTLINAPNLTQIACHRNGSHVLEKLAEMTDCTSKLSELRECVKQRITELSASELGKKVLGKFGFAVDIGAEANKKCEA
mmetsp:Transcript_102630/g.162148  ORF Transcript_102630/g.162148 Transcript_102630/m.162148 type:complete len:460 (+) Transcript_102630:80-1459(+)